LIDGEETPDRINLAPQLSKRLKGTSGSALGSASSTIVGTSGNLGAAAAAAVLSGGSSRVTSSGVELRELRRHNYKASVSVLSHLNKGNAASPYVSIGGGHRQRTRAHRAMNMARKYLVELKLLVAKVRNHTNL